MGKEVGMPAKVQEHAAGIQAGTGRMKSLLQAPYVHSAEDGRSHSPVPDTSSQGLRNHQGSAQLITPVSTRALPGSWEGWSPLHSARSIPARTDPAHLLQLSLSGTHSLSMFCRWKYGDMQLVCLA